MQDKENQPSRVKKVSFPENTEFHQQKTDMRVIKRSEERLNREIKDLTTSRSPIQTIPHNAHAITNNQHLQKTYQEIFEQRRGISRASLTTTTIQQKTDLTKHRSPLQQVTQNEGKSERTRKAAQKFLDEKRIKEKEDANAADKKERTYLEYVSARKSSSVLSR